MNLRDVEVSTLVSNLHMHELKKRDIIVEPKQLSMEDADLIVTNIREHFSEAERDRLSYELGTNVTRSRLTHISHGQLATKLDIPRGYYNRVLGSSYDLLDRNVNHWLDNLAQLHEENNRLSNIMLRLFVPQPGETMPTVRAVLSDRYRIIDDFDVLASASSVMQQNDIKINSCDRDERSLYLRAESNIADVDATELMQAHSQMTGEERGEQHVAKAGFVVINSETGHNTFKIVPRIVLQPSGIALTRKSDALSKRHSGPQMPVGLVDFSSEEQETERRLIAEKTREAVSEFASEDYVQEVIDETT